jgi:hypothetical protein
MGNGTIGSPKTAADAAPAKKRRRSPWLSALQIATHGPDRYSEARNRASSGEPRLTLGSQRPNNSWLAYSCERFS